MLRLWLCGGAAGVRWYLACPSSLLDPPCDAACGAAACRVLPSLGARRRASNPRLRGWWRSLSGSVWDEAGAGFWGVVAAVLS